MHSLNKMTHGNIAIVFAPVFFRNISLKIEEAAINAKIAVDVLHFLIEYYNKIFAIEDISIIDNLV